MAGTILHRCSVSAPGARTVAVTTLPPGRQSAGRARLWARACRCMKPVVNSSAAQDGGEDGSADRKPTRKKRTRPPRQSQQHGAVTLSLQDLAYGRPPWRLKKLAELNEMGLDRLLPSALLEMDPTEQGGNCAAEVEIRLRVEKVGAGFYVKGRASTDVALRCSVCASPYQCGVTEAPFQVWLSRNDSDVDQAGPDEVPWPSHLVRSSCPSPRRPAELLGPAAC